MVMTDGSRKEDGQAWTPMFASLHRIFPEYAPLSADLSPEMGIRVAAVERHCLRWAQRHRLLHSLRQPGRILNSRPGVGVCLAFPAWEFDTLTLMGELSFWLTAFDDAYCEEDAEAVPRAFADRIGTMMRMLEPDPEPREPGYASALAEVMSRIRATAGPRHVQRIVTALQGVFAANLWEILVDAESVALDDYLTMRRHLVLGHISIAQAELAARCDLPDDLYDSPAVRRLRDAVANIIAWINDLYSWRCEKKRKGTSALSLPGILARRDSCDPEEALRRSLRMLDAELVAARRQINEFRERPGLGLADYAEAMASLVGSNAWYEGNLRYD
jgi:hypothetical protein